MGGPFTVAARDLYQHGWHPFPLPAGEKAPPPVGYTGAGGDADVTQLNAWLLAARGDNVGIRLDTTLIGIDVDAYDGHGGADTIAKLVEQYGPLPTTISTTSRGPGDSRIHYYRVPSGLIFPGQLGPGVDVIQHHHRYAVAPPSQHPDGPLYAWWFGDAMLDRTPHVTEAAALPPAWFALQLHTPDRRLSTLSAPTINQQLAAASNGADNDDSIADHITATHRWADVLEGDGWQLVTDRAHEQRWLRPGKVGRGISAVLHMPDGPFVVFTTSVPALQQPWAVTADGNAWAYSIFGYLSATRYMGDRSECARDFRRQRNNDTWAVMTRTVATVALDTEPDDSDDSTRFRALRLNDAWERADVDANEWLAYPLIPARRAVALHAPAKAGKSIVALSAVASMVLGRPLFDRWPIDRPITVGYLDYEMTDTDVFDRLDELGYGPADRLGDHLHYVLLPTVDALDTYAGGAQVLAWAKDIGADLVVFDTLGRAVIGPENDADTFRNFYRHTGRALKAAGIATLRTDHTGKALDRGQRGSSSKNEDVDLVWRLTRTDIGAVLDVTHARVDISDRTINLQRTDDGHGFHRWVSTDLPVVRAETIALIRDIDRLAVPVDVSLNKAYEAFHAAGGKAAKAAFITAQKERVNRPKTGTGHSEPVVGSVPELGVVVDNANTTSTNARPGSVPGPNHQDTNRDKVPHTYVWEVRTTTRDDAPPTTPPELW